MSKRSFPFNDCTPLQLKTHVKNKHVNNDQAHMEEVYAKTQSLLKAGAKAFSNEENNLKLSTVCQNCKKTANSTVLTSCSFCDKKVCVYCFNVCFRCEHTFCVLCSVISYDNPEEKSFCLSCCSS